MENLFTKFFPDHRKQAIEFAESLPEYKLSMAKLQGHFLKYRGQPLKALENAQEITQTQVETIDQFSVGQWLLRLNLIEVAPRIAELDLVQITDL